GALRILGGADISASTFSTARGGDLSVRAGSLTIDGSAQPQSFTGIETRSDPGGDFGGAAGNLSVIVGNALQLLGSGEISATTFANGRGGNLSVQAGSITLRNGSRIDADTHGTGHGGEII